VYQYQNIVNQKYNDSLSGIAQTHKALFISIYDLLTDEELDDGLHPNQKGHQKLFETIKKVL
jgi:lysophospholipase L1-like esterase